MDDTMTRSFRPTSYTSSLSFKLFLFLFLSVLLMFTVYTVVSSGFQRRNLERWTRADAARHGDLIRQGLYASMLLNERERTYSFIRRLGNEPGIEAVHIYNKQGEIKFSNDESEIGNSVDLQAEACYVCHASTQPLGAVATEERSRIFRKPGSDYRILGLITPIYNDESCWNSACHAHSADKSILGVLDVQMSMQDADEASAAASRHAFTLALVVIFFSSLVMAVVLYRAVYLPTQELRRGTEALAAGDLDVRIELNSSDELGVLAESFNHMASSLRAADAELRAWSQTLEERVQRKTEELQGIHQQMMQVEKAASLGKMAATVAHELNNPLSGVLTCAKLVTRKVDRVLPDGTEKQMILDNLEMIRSESTRCGNIVRDLLTYARQSSAEFGRAHLHELVGRALKLIGHHTQLGGVETEAELQLEDDSLICDGEQIVQALIALMINAVEAMPNGGRLTVKTWEPAHGALGRVCLSVSDTGVGIPEEARARIFDPFFSTKNETKGVGLGLAVVYGIIERHEGKISVESSPGERTTFTIEIPRDPKRAMAARTQARKRL